MNTNAIFSAVLMIFGLMFFSAQENYNTLIFKGNQQFDKKNYDNASSKYMEAAKLNEKDFTAHYNLGNALYKRKMYDEAKAEFEKAENLATTIPDKSAALYNSGNAYMQKNDSKKAAELYKQALKQDPYNETIRKNYEIAMRKEKEKQQQQHKKTIPTAVLETIKTKTKTRVRTKETHQNRNKETVNKIKAKAKETIPIRVRTTTPIKCLKI